MRNLSTELQVLFYSTKGIKIESSFLKDQNEFGFKVSGFKKSFLATNIMDAFNCANRILKNSTL